MSSNGQWIRPTKRLGIYLRDRFRCLLCGDHLEGLPGRLTLDHVVPRSKGGGNRADNLYTCCRSCNSSRQDTDIWKFIQRVQHPLSHDWLAESDLIYQGVMRHLERPLQPYLEQAKEIIRGRDD